jgi:hypothetical protein
MGDRQAREDSFRFYRILESRLDEGEMRTLCFALGVDYDSLPGVGRAAKARELVAFLERRMRIGDLIARGKELWPDVDWDESGEGAGGTRPVGPSHPPASHVRTPAPRGNETVHGDKVGGDQVGGDNITIGDIGSHVSVAVGRETQSVQMQIGELGGDQAPTLLGALYRAIGDRAPAPGPDKRDLAEMVRQLEREVGRGERANPRKVRRLLRLLRAMAEDVWEAAVARLSDPASGASDAVRRTAREARNR